MFRKPERVLLPCHRTGGRLTVWLRSVAVRRTGVCPEVDGSGSFSTVLSSPPPPSLSLFPQWLLGSRAAASVAARVGEACSEHDNSFMWWEGAAAAAAAGGLSAWLRTSFARPRPLPPHMWREREREREDRGGEGLYPI